MTHFLTEILELLSEKLRTQGGIAVATSTRVTNFVANKSSIAGGNGVVKQAHIYYRL